MDMLSKPINWHDPVFWPMLGDLQGNILKGHGRDHTINAFLRFSEDRADAVRAAIRNLAPQITTALRQLKEVQSYKELERPGGTGIFFFLTAQGYKKIGENPPNDEAFLAGMDKRQLGDPSSEHWEPHLRPGIDALLIVADDDLNKVGNAFTALTQQFQKAGIAVAGVDSGHALRSEPSANEPKGRGIEHFGYVDGRSQPLMLTDDVEKEEYLTAEEMKEDAAPGNTLRQWDPAFGPGQVALVRDPNGLREDSFGSYLIYRKLEQRVRSFKEHEEALGTALKLDDKERAGAMVVGRFEDGTPLILSKEEEDLNPTPNSFTYDHDPKGLKCPIHAHIRKVNPRQDSEEQRSHLMPRRGIPYGERKSLEDKDLPDGDVGLLFMAYNQDIGRQFEVTQKFWANSFGFPNDTAKGIDPIIGQNPDAPEARWQTHYGVERNEVPFDFRNFVTMKGGAYFFAPSRSFLENL